MDAERIRFLYRTDQGRIDRATWRRGAGALLAVLIPFTLIWLALEPYTTHDLSKTPFFAPGTAAAYAYVIFYAFVVMLIAVSFINLSAKRFRDRGSCAAARAREHRATARAACRRGAFSAAARRRSHVALVCLGDRCGSCRRRRLDRLRIGLARRRSPSLSYQ